MVVKSEELLVQTAQNGNIDSFAALYKRHYNTMLALAYSLLADKHLAEDTAQQTFAIACRKLPQLNNPAKFVAWLAAICRNRAKDMRRSKANFVNLPELPSTEKVNNNNHDIIRQAIWKLRPVDREPILLRYYNGLSYAEISTVLGISTRAVNGRLFRAKKKIEKYLKQNGITGGDYENA